MVSKSTKSYIKKITTLKTSLDVIRAKQIFQGMFSTSEISEIEQLLTDAVPSALTNRCVYSSWSSNTTHSVELPIDPKYKNAWGHYYRVKKPFAKKDPNLKKISEMVQDKLDAMNLDEVKITYHIRLVGVSSFGYSSANSVPTHIAIHLEGEVPPTLNEIASNKQSARACRNAFIRDRAEIDTQIALLDKFLGPLDE